MIKCDFCGKEIMSTNIGNVTYSDIVDIVKENRDGRTAIIVPSNEDANKISNKLGDIPHFKISGTMAAL